MQTLPWYPPAPAPGPASVLQLPPDEWALESKIDGIRVIWLNGRPFTRHGGLFTSSKGADRLFQILVDIPHTLDGEWVPAWDTFFAFDLPDCPLDNDGRRETLVKLLAGQAGRVALAAATKFPHVSLVTSSTTADFAQTYACWKSRGAEGVVLKRRRALYCKQLQPGGESRDWFKRRFVWDVASLLCLNTLARHP